MSKQLTTDVSIRKWKVSKDTETYSCGNRSGLYIRGYISQKKCFYWRADTWIKLGDYPDLSLAIAREFVSGFKKARKVGKTIKEIQTALVVSKTADEFSTNIKHLVRLDDQQNLTYGEVFTEWYERKASTLWQEGPSRRRPAAMHQHWVPEELKRKPISLVKRQDIFSFMEDMFCDAYVSAGKQLGYMGRVFEYAINSGYAETNPIPPRRAFEAVAPPKKAHGYLEYQRMPELWQWIDTRSLAIQTKFAMKTVMLTGHRISVVVQAKWDHIDLEAGIWTVPPRHRSDKQTTGKMKSGRKFSMKLPEPYLDELLKIKTNSPFVFPSPMTQGYVTPNATLKAFKRFDQQITNHGFRNSIKIWGRNEGFPDYVMDAYVDHGLEGLNKSYRREDLSFQTEQATAKLLKFLEKSNE